MCRGILQEYISTCKSWLVPASENDVIPLGVTGASEPYVGAWN